LCKPVTQGNVTGRHSLRRESWHGIIKRWKNQLLYTARHVIVLSRLIHFSLYLERVSAKPTSRHLPGEARWKQPQAAQPSIPVPNLPPSIGQGPRSTNGEQTLQSLPTIPTQDQRRIASFARAYKCPEQSYTPADCLAGQQRHPSDDTDAR
jgi:hypothetical protein